MGCAYPYLNVSCTLCSVAGVFKVTEFGAVDKGSEPAGVISVCIIKRVYYVIVIVHMHSLTNFSMLCCMYNE